MKMRVVIRGFLLGKLLFEDHATVTERNLEKLVPRLASKHALAMAQHRLHMIEIEFLDEPNPLERFFRFGTDPAGMVRPIDVNLGKTN